MKGVFFILVFVFFFLWSPGLLVSWSFWTRVAAPGLVSQLGYLGKLKLAIDPTARGRPIGELRSDKGPVSSGVIWGDDLLHTFRVFSGADFTAPSSGRARRRYPAPQQY